MTNKIDITESLSRNQWGDFFDQFSENNRGRHLVIESISSELGDEELIQNTPLMAIDYDRPGKGNDLMIEVGKEEVTYSHTVDAPTEISMGRDSDGQIIAIWIGDAAGAKTLIKLRAS